MGCGRAHWGDLHEIRNVIAENPKESVGNTSKNQTMGGGWKSKRNWARF